MEFKYRAGDLRPPPFASHSSYGVGFSSGKAWRGSDAVADSNLGWEAFLRDTEKQWIREEIIAMEVERRMMLEDEVRRELMLEREMGLRHARDGLPREEKLPMWFGYERILPMDHQRETRLMHENRLSLSHDTVDKPPFPLLDSQEVPRTEIKPDYHKDGIIILGKPDLNLYLSGVKRKASSISAIDTGEYPGVCQKKKPQEEWTCALCQVSATSERGLNEHIRGKKHKAKEASLPQKNSEGGNDSLQVYREQKGSKRTGGPKTMKKMVKTKGLRDQMNFKFWCGMCQIGAYSKVVMLSHEKGKKHRALLRELGHQNDEVGCNTASGAWINLQRGE